MNEGVGIGLGDAIAIVIAVGALFVSWLSYRLKKQSDQIRIARERL